MTRQEISLIHCYVVTVIFAVFTLIFSDIEDKRMCAILASIFLAAGWIIQATPNNEVKK